MCGFGMWSFGTDFVFFYVIDGIEFRFMCKSVLFFLPYFMHMYYNIGPRFVFSLLELPKEKII